MMNETILGKISNVRFGKEEGRFGLWLTLSGSWATQTSYVCWDPEEIKPGENHKWDEEGRDRELARIMRKVSELMHKAKVNRVEDLLGKPIEFTSKNGMLSEWRILEEVL